MRQRLLIGNLMCIPAPGLANRIANTSVLAMVSAIWPLYPLLPEHNR